MTEIVIQRRKEGSQKWSDPLQAHFPTGEKPMVNLNLGGKKILVVHCGRPHRAEIYESKPIGQILLDRDSPPEATLRPDGGKEDRYEIIVGSIQFRIWHATPQFGLKRGRR